MDWPRARAILLAGFSVVNLALVLFLWLPSGGGWGTLLPNSPEHLREVEARLKDVGAELKAQLPQSQALPLLRVSRAQTPIADLGRISGHPTSEGDSHSSPLPGIATQRAGRAWMAPLITDEGMALYPVGAEGVAYHPVEQLDEEKARTAAQTIVSEMGLLPDGARFRRTYRDATRGIAVEFVQEMGQSPLFSGQVTAFVSKRGVEEVDYFWLTVQGTRGEPKMVIPASQAILRLTGELERQVAHELRTGLVFSKIELGYYSAHSSEAQTWDEVPVWRIDLESGTSYYVEGFTGFMVGDHLLPQ